MTQGTKQLSIYGAVNLLECHEFEPPQRFKGDTMKWFSEEVQAGRLVCHDRTGRKIEPGERRGLLLGLNDETTSIARLNEWLASIDHLRRIPETACVPTAAVILERHDEDSRPVFRMPRCPAEVPAELLALPADAPVVCIEEEGSMWGAHYTAAAKLVDYIRGRLPAGATADAPEPASAPAVALPEPVAPVPPMPSTSAPAVAGPESAGALPLTNWKMRVQEAAAARWLDLRGRGMNPTVVSILGDMVRWCRENDVLTSSGITPSEGYLRTHVLGGKNWTPPTKQRRTS